MTTPRYARRPSRPAPPRGGTSEQGEAWATPRDSGRAILWPQPAGQLWSLACVPSPTVLVGGCTWVSDADLAGRLQDVDDDGDGFKRPGLQRRRERLPGRG